MLFSWLRSQVRNAVLAGIDDAIREVAPDGAAPDPLAALHGRLALPASAAPPVVTEEPAATRNGRRKAAETTG